MANGGSAGVRTPFPKAPFQLALLSSFLALGGAVLQTSPLRARASDCYSDSHKKE